MCPSIVYVDFYSCNHVVAALASFNAIKRTHKQRSTLFFHSKTFNPISPQTHTHTHSLLPHLPTAQVTSWPLRLSCCHGNKLISIQSGSWMIRTWVEGCFVKVCSAGGSHSFLSFRRHHTLLLTLCFISLFGFVLFFILLCNLATLHLKRGECLVDSLSVIVFMWAWENTIAELMIYLIC